MLDDSPLQESDRRSPRTFRQRRSVSGWWPSSGRLGKQVSPGRAPFGLRHHGPGDVGSGDLGPRRVGSRVRCRQLALITGRCHVTRALMAKMMTASGAVRGEGSWKSMRSQPEICSLQGRKT